MAKADFKALRQALKDGRKDVISDLIDYFSLIGEAARNAAVDWASQVRPYKDQTKHLRGSIGYIIVLDGEVVKESAFGATDSAEGGRQAGRSYARSLAPEYPTGCTLIMVAGKKYASYVANRGYDVLDSAETVMRDMSEKVLEMLESQLENE